MTDTDIIAIGIWIFLFVGGGIGALIFSVWSIRYTLKKRGLYDPEDDRDDNDDIEK